MSVSGLESQSTLSGFCKIVTHNDPLGVSVFDTPRNS